MNTYYKIIAGRLTFKGLFLPDRLKFLDKFEIILSAHILHYMITINCLKHAGLKQLVFKYKKLKLSP